jgi:Transposase IS116/IS110/IS902 family
VAAFPSAAHLASWAGVCPGNNESAGKRHSGRSRRGSKWLRGTVIEAARAAARTRDTYLGAQYRRIRARRGANRASLAVAHSLLVAVWHMLTTGETYTDPGADYYTRRDPARATRRLIAQLERLGHAAGGRCWLTNGIFSSETTRRRPSSWLARTGFHLGLRSLPPTPDGVLAGRPLRKSAARPPRRQLRGVTGPGPADTASLIRASAVTAHA